VRLKDKLGTRSLPSAEIEFRGARGWLVGEDGRGMVPLVTNLSHARSGPAVSPEMRAALDAAIHHCSHRSAFGERFADQPAMANVLADLAIESEGPTAAWLTAPCPPKSIRAPSSIVRFPHERRLIPEIESRRTVLSAHEPSA
jgi:putative acyl-CoA dehydrogenase